MGQRMRRLDCGTGRLGRAESGAASLPRGGRDRTKKREKISTDGQKMSGLERKSVCNVGNCPITTAKILTPVMSPVLDSSAFICNYLALFLYRGKNWCPSLFMSVFQRKKVMINVALSKYLAAMLMRKMHYKMN